MRYGIATHPEILGYGHLAMDVVFVHLRLIHRPHSKVPLEIKIISLDCRTKFLLKKVRWHLCTTPFHHRYATFDQGIQLRQFLPFWILR